MWSPSRIGQIVLLETSSSENDVAGHSAGSGGSGIAGIRRGSQ
jgi:hypothetical protein